MFKLLLCAVLTLSGVQARPQDGDAAGLMDRAHAAIARKLDAGPVLRYSGKATWAGLDGHGNVQETYAGLDKAKLRTDFTGFGVFQYGTDGRIVWEKTPAGVTIRRGWDAAEFTRRFGRSQHTNWRELYTSAKSLGKEVLDGTPCLKIQLVPRLFDDTNELALEQEPATDTLFLDEATLLLKRVDAQAVGIDAQPTQIRTTYADWRAVDGVQYAFHREVTVSGFTLMIDYDKIEHGLELPDDFFDVDPAVKQAVEAAHQPGAKTKETDPQYTTLEERHIAAVRVKCKHADLQKTLSVALPEVFGYLSSIGVTPAGFPMVRYHSFGDEVDLEAAAPVSAPVPAKGRVKPEKLPGGRAVVCWHVGPYDELGETHEKIQAFLAAENLVLNGAFWEEYWTDPGLEPDPGKWRTKIVTPVKDKEPAPKDPKDDEKGDGEKESGDNRSQRR